MSGNTVCMHETEGIVTPPVEMQKKKKQLFLLKGLRKIKNKYAEDYSRSLSYSHIVVQL